MKRRPIELALISGMTLETAFAARDALSGRRKGLGAFIPFAGPAIMASVGFEVLKQVTTVYLEFVTHSPSTVLFGPILGLLFFSNLVSRFLLFVTAWTATAKENMATVVPPPPPAVIRPRVVVERGLGLGATAGAFSAGAILAWLGRRRL